MTTGNGGDNDLCTQIEHWQAELQEKCIICIITKVKREVNHFLPQQRADSNLRGNCSRFIKKILNFRTSPEIKIDLALIWYPTGLKMKFHWELPTGLRVSQKPTVTRGCKSVNSGDILSGFFWMNSIKSLLAFVDFCSSKLGEFS